LATSRLIPETASGGGEIEERTIYNRKGKEVILPEPRYIRNDSIYDYDEWNDIDLIRPMRYNAELAYGSEKVATGGGNRTQTHHHLFPDRRDLFYQYFIDAKKNHFINRSVFQDRITGLFSFYGGIIDILMKDKNIDKSIDFLDTMLQSIIDKNVIMDKLVITKSLRSFYKNPNQIILLYLNSLHIEHTHYCG
jgi:hypothetical protein